MFTEMEQKWGHSDTDHQNRISLPKSPGGFFSQISENPFKAEKLRLRGGVGRTDNTKG